MLLLNFRGFLIEVDRDVVKKLPKDSEFMKYIHSKYNTTFESIIEDEQPGNKIYLNRNGFMFYSILDYLETGQLHFAHNVCSDLILDELQFWGYKPLNLSLCCLDRLLKDTEEDALIQQLNEKWEALKKSDDMIHPGRETGRLKLHSANKGAGERGEDNLVSVTKGPAIKQRSKIRDIILHPTSCWLAKIYCAGILLAIVLSVIVLLLETEPDLRGKISNNDVLLGDNSTNTSGSSCDSSEEGKTLANLVTTLPHRGLIAVDVITTAVLTLDFILRLILTKERRKFLCKILTFIDIISIVPVWISLVIVIYLNSTGDVSRVDFFKYLVVLRALRVFRFCHITLHNKQLRIIGLGIRSSWKELLILLCVVFMYACLFGIMAFYIETLSGKDTFTTGWDGVYWAIITMTTVGYGDYYPITETGKMFAVACCLVGIVVIAMATTILVNTFFTVYQSIEKLERLSEVKYGKLLDKNKLKLSNS